ncbi:hypothetical protein GGI02_000209 [Coemansia sp. RSA 2322]|uniref:Uncharacterized protein n=1 Tax=Coemansia thaxteri TaxID=2663907 RepID=A0A9W8EE58_9FUNG|nr:hypothetical protein H4R26_003903 [Coemansia thaxteri]KAJ2474316.1 hypothetical protein GGI02_000209 [Coemansia sp. RSA 2322]
MANIAAAFTSGLVLGSGAVYAFVSHFTEQSHAMSYKLRWATAALAQAETREGQVGDAKPKAMVAYKWLSLRLSGNAIPLAKTEWNNTVSLAANSVSSADVDTDRLVSLLRKQHS